MTTLFLYALLAQDPAPARDYRLEFENAWVRVLRLRAAADGKAAGQDRPATPELSVCWKDDDKPGAIRFTRGVGENQKAPDFEPGASQCLRIELKTKPVDLPQRDVRIAPENREPYENGMLRIARVTCPALTTCPMSQHPEDPALVLGHGKFAWQDAGLQLNLNGAADAMEQIRIEVKSRPAPQ